jgi:HEAT repeat protein
MTTNGSAAAAPFLVYSLGGHRCGHPPDDVKAMLVEIGDPAITALIDAAQYGNDNDRHTIANVLAKFDHSVVAMALANALTNPQIMHREQIVDVVRRMGAIAKDVIPVLIWILEEDETASLDLQWRAARALCEFGPAAAPAGPGIVQFYRDSKLPNNEVPKRRQTPPPGRSRQIEQKVFYPWGNPFIIAMGRLGPNADGVLDFLISEIEDPKDEGAFVALGMLGPAAAKAQPALRAALTKVPESARPKVVQALRLTGDQDNDRGQTQQR